MPTLRISPELLGDHLWIVTEKKPAEPIDLDDLGLSDDLADRVEAWGDAFDAIYDADNPSQSAFPDREAELRWRAEGDAIAAAIREELGPDWRVEIEL